MEPNAIIFYNGFNLLIDIIIAYCAYRSGKYFGFIEGYNENQPPF